MLRPRHMHQLAAPVTDGPTRHANSSSDDTRGELEDMPEVHISILQTMSAEFGAWPYHRHNPRDQPLRSLRWRQLTLLKRMKALQRPPHPFFIANTKYYPRTWHSQARLPSVDTIVHSEPLERTTVTSKGYLQIARDVQRRNRLVISILEKMFDIREHSDRPPLVFCGPTTAYHPVGQQGLRGQLPAEDQQHPWISIQQTFLYVGPRHLPLLMWASKRGHATIWAAAGSRLVNAAEAWTGIEAHTRLLQANRTGLPQLKIERYLAAELTLSIDPSTLKQPWSFPQNQRDEGHARGTRAARILPLLASQSATNEFYRAEAQAGHAGRRQSNGVTVCPEPEKTGETQTQHMHQASAETKPSQDYLLKQAAAAPQQQPGKAQDLTGVWCE